MSEADVRHAVQEALEEQGLSREVLEGLASQLVWRVGRVSDDAPVTVRLGYASDAATFAELPRLRGASDEEIEEALADGTLRVEWVGGSRGR